MMTSNNFSNNCSSEQAVIKEEMAWNCSNCKTSQNQDATWSDHSSEQHIEEQCEKMVEDILNEDNIVNENNNENNNENKLFWWDWTVKGELKKIMDDLKVEYKGRPKGCADCVNTEKGLKMYHGVPHYDSSFVCLYIFFCCFHVCDFLFFFFFF